MLAKRLSACTYLSSIVPSYTMLKSMRKPKNRHFHHIFVSPGDPPGAFTLNVVWIESEFDAYKLSRCMCPSNYNRFWDRARYWWKQWSKRGIFHTPLHSTPPPPLGGSRQNSATPFGVEKTRMSWLPEGKKNSKISLFVLAQLTNVTDRQIDRRTDTGWRHIPRLCIASHGKT